MKDFEILFETLANEGRARYGMEAINQLEHALQCAALAEREGNGPEMVVAALFHDLGHMVDDFRPMTGPRKEDDLHEAKSASFLSAWFGADVTEPVRMHVAAKRYLCAVSDGYWEKLSDASRHSLELQGGPFDQEAAENFINKPFAKDAVRLRQWDDMAKVPELRVPRLSHYRPYVEALINTSQREAS